MSSCTGPRVSSSTLESLTGDADGIEAEEFGCEGFDFGVVVIDENFRANFHGEKFVRGSGEDADFGEAGGFRRGGGRRSLGARALAGGGDEPCGGQCENAQCFSHIAPIFRR